MKTKRKNIFKSLLALTLALIMVLGAAPLSELAGVDWASLFAPKVEAAEKNTRLATSLNSALIRRVRSRIRHLFLLSTAFQKTGSATAITATTTAMVLRGRAIG